MNDTRDESQDEQGEEGPDLYTRVYALEQGLDLLRRYVVHLRDVLEEVNKQTPNLAIRSFSWEEWVAQEDAKSREFTRR